MMMNIRGLVARGMAADGRLQVVDHLGHPSLRDAASPVAPRLVGYLLVTVASMLMLF